MLKPSDNSLNKHLGNKKTNAVEFAKELQIFINEHANSETTIRVSLQSEHDAEDTDYRLNSDYCVVGYHTKNNEIVIINHV